MRNYIIFISIFYLFILFTSVASGADSQFDFDTDWDVDALDVGSFIQSWDNNPTTLGQFAHSLGNLIQISDADTDGDGIKDWIEKKLGTDPNDGHDYPKPGAHYQYDELGRIIRIIRIKPRTVIPE